MNFSNLIIIAGLASFSTSLAMAKEIRHPQQVVVNICGQDEKAQTDLGVSVPENNLALNFKIRDGILSFNSTDKTAAISNMSGHSIILGNLASEMSKEGDCTRYPIDLFVKTDLEVSEGASFPCHVGSGGVFGKVGTCRTDTYSITFLVGRDISITETCKRKSEVKNGTPIRALFGC